jgi:hypothetical protein
MLCVILKNGILLSVALLNVIAHTSTKIMSKNFFLKISKLKQI